MSLERVQFRQARQKGPGVRGLHAEIPGQECTPDGKLCLRSEYPGAPKKGCGAAVQPHRQPGQKYKECTREERQRQQREPL